MTYLRFTRFQNIFLSLILVSLGSSCSAIRGLLWEEENVTPAASHEKKKEKSISSKFEWAVQNYEAGSYDEAIGQFTALKKEGANVSGFEMIPFYLGMSYARRNQDAKARVELESFLQSQPKSQGVEARMALLLIYERARQWDQLVAMAAETNQLQVFQDNRALLKLVWARALREKGELLGARTALKDATQYIENTPEESTEGKDLWGRYYYVQVITQLQECQELTAKSVGKKKLFSTWLEAEVDCWKMAFEPGTKIYRLGNSWSVPTQEALSNGMEKFGGKIRDYLNELKSLEPKRNLQKQARQQLYRSLEAVDAKLKFFKEQALNSQPLEQLRKRIDLLLVSI